MAGRRFSPSRSRSRSSSISCRLSVACPAGSSIATARPSAERTTKVPDSTRSTPWRCSWRAFSILRSSATTSDTGRRSASITRSLDGPSSSSSASQTPSAACARSSHRSAGSGNSAGDASPRVASPGPSVAARLPRHHQPTAIPTTSASRKAVIPGASPCPGTRDRCRGSPAASRSTPRRSHRARPAPACTRSSCRKCRR